MRRFPGRAEQLATLARTSEPFRDMCQELAAAEEALSALDMSGMPRAIQRRAEIEGWIVRLTTEMSEALDASKVISLTGRKRR